MVYFNLNSRLRTKLMKRPNDSLIGAFAGLLIVYVAENSCMHPEEGLGARLIIFPLIGAIIGVIVGRIRDRSA